MSEKFRVLRLLLWKNFLVRRRHWIQSSLLQIFIPIGIIMIGLLMPRVSSPSEQKIESDSYYEIESSGDIFRHDYSYLKIRYAPSNAITDKIMMDVKECVGLSTDDVVASANENIMVDDMLRVNNYEQSEIGIVFESIVDTEPMPKLFKYKLRTNRQEFHKFFYPGQNGQFNGRFGPNHKREMHVALCLDEAYIKQVVPTPTYKTNLNVQQRPYPPYEQSSLYSESEIPIILDGALLLAFLIIVCIEVTFPANEKFIGINVLMSVNGISNRFNLLSWLISALIWSLGYLIPVAVAMKCLHLEDFLPFLDKGNVFLCWVAMLFHICHLITFGHHLMSYFWKPFRGILVLIIVTMGLQTANAFVHALPIKRLLLYAGILSPNFLLSRTIKEFDIYEYTDGLGWSDLFTPGTDAIREGSVGVMIIFSIIGILFHFTMTVYIYAVRPGKYGIPRHMFYIFQKKQKKSADREKILNDDRDETSKKAFEHVEPGSLEPGIEIRGLEKVYTTDLFGKTRVEALRGVSIDIYKRQITALLGHNGAGKTTMMSILSGLTDATEGVAFIDGKNILDGMDTIDNNIGLCPQENMMFPDLTVREQLMLFAMMKANNKTRHDLESEVRNLLYKVNLPDKTDNYPVELSGGQKRRLCLASSIIGGAKILILDEPTSGMDAESKRDIWNILLKMRGERTILISTHDMEEADILGDRVAIMHSGQLRSYGTSMFLKKLYGDGQVEVTLSVEPRCEITEVLKAIDIDAHVLNRDDGKIVLALPPSASLPVALDRLENSKERLGITGMSVSIITLEQVFMRVTNDGSGKEDSTEDVEVFEKLTGFPYYLQTFAAFLNKKLKYAWQNPWNILLSVILPCLPMVIMLSLIIPDRSHEQPYAVTLNAYPNTKAFVHSDNPLFSQMYQKTIKNFNGIATEVTPTTSVTNALLNYARNDLQSYREGVVVSAEFNNTSSGVVKANGIYSADAVFGMFSTINCLTNTIIKTLTGNEEYGIEVSMHTLPHEIMLNPTMINLQSVGIVVFSTILLAPAMALYAVQPLSEALSGIKQLQEMTGAPKFLYWAGTFFFDYIQYIISVSILLVLSIIVDSSAQMQIFYGTEISITLGLFILFGINTLSLIYLITFLKRSNNVTILLLTIFPIVLVMIELILSVLAPLLVGNESYQTFRKIQHHLFLLVPHVSFGWGQYSFFSKALINAYCRRKSILFPESRECTGTISYYQDVDDIVNLKEALLWLGLTPILYLGLIFILEQRYIGMLIMKLRKTKPIADSANMDGIVKEERQIVNDEIAKRENNQDRAYKDSENILLVHELRKSYGHFQAVKGISFRVKESECFGLLGVNGAGKSTTFKMLTNDTLPNNGSVYLKQYNNLKDQSNYSSLMGYCPQQDAILVTLNAWDHLYLFAKLRGIPRAQVPRIVKQWITKLNLTRCAAQPSGTYSGGNKRRLNIALALIGNPPLVLMDEPTTGVDPAARRSLWTTLKTCQNAGQSIILTSHSMEECEVLCNRLVIMVGGRIVCVGASEQLKQRFGSGYNIHIKLLPMQQGQDIEAIKRRIISVLNCNLTDQNSGFLSYHVIDPEATWTIMYSLMDELKNEYNCIEDYVVLSSTLEQLFIQFARSPNNAIDHTAQPHVVSPA